MNREKQSVNAYGSRLDAGLLLLRVGAGLSLFVLFGLAKVKDAAGYWHTGHWEFVAFNRKAGLPVPVLIAYAQSLNESLGALLVAFGFMSRYTAGLLFVGFAGATYCSIREREPAWLMAAYFALMFATLTLTGPGRWSIDGLLTSRGVLNCRLMVSKGRRQ